MGLRGSRRLPHSRVTQTAVQGGNVQCLEPPKFWPPQSILRSRCFWGTDSNAGRKPWCQGRGWWRSQSSLSDRRATFNSIRAEVKFLKFPRFGESVSTKTISPLARAEMFTFRRTAELAFTFAMASLWLGGSIENRAAAQQVRPLPVEDALKVHYFAEYSPISFSPDGKWLAYAIRDNQRSKDIDTETYARTRVEGIGIGADVCISNIETTETRRLTGGQGDN